MDIFSTHHPWVFPSFRAGDSTSFSTCEIAPATYQFSRRMVGPIVQCILQQSSTLPHSVLDQQQSIFRDLLKHKQQALTDAARSICHQSPSDLQYIIDCLQQKGAPSWLTSLPIEQHGFVLHKGALTNAICLRYGWTPPRLPSHCVCGSDFSTSHVFSCPHGAFPTIRHNNTHDFTVSLLSEVCHDVKVEHYLQPLTGETLRYRVGRRNKTPK